MRKKLLAIILIVCAFASSQVSSTEFLDQSNQDSTAKPQTMRLQEESVEYMNARAIHEYKEGSLQDKFTMPQVFQILNELGAESYRVDLTGLRITVYGSRGDFREESLSPPLTSLTVSPTFSMDLIEKGISSISADNNYINFLRQIAAAGVSQYQVYLKEGIMNYIGRNGELLSKIIFKK